LFLDANVIFTAAHNPDGKAAFLFENSSLNLWNLCSSPYAAEEARRNIEIKYPNCVDRLEKLLKEIEFVPQPPPASIAIALPEKDRPIYIAARGAKRHLLTGDLKHFGQYMNQPKQSEGIIIQTVAEYLAGF
jgi:hypothetical protein